MGPPYELSVKQMENDIERPLDGKDFLLSTHIQRLHLACPNNIRTDSSLAPFDNNIVLNSNAFGPKCIAGLRMSLGVIFESYWRGPLDI
jgi:hypothetical protein